MMHTLRRFAVALFAVLAAATFAPAQLKEPPRAEKLDVQIRYRIRADRDERVRQYRVLEKHLDSLGFVDARKNDPDRDLDILDPTHERFTGTIPGAKVLELLNDVRVQNILLAPAGFAYPDAPEKPVAIRLGLRGGLLSPVQQQLHKQLVTHLAQLGFVEALGYETAGYTLVRGSIPLKSLDLLIKDIRTEPSGWFLAATPVDKLPSPLRDRNPIRWAEVLPITEFAAPFAPPPMLPAQLKYTADLRALLLDPAARDKPLRVEAIFEERIGSLESLRTRITGRYVGASLDGIIGNVVSVRLPRASMAEIIANEPSVVGVRLPRQGTETIVASVGGKGVTAAEALKAARIDELHKLGYTGAGQKVVLIGSDFTGADKLIGTELPKRTTIVDLTTELSAEVLPAPADPARLGNGTAAAKALAAAAPGAELVLVRIDPGCFFHLHTIIRLARAEIDYTDALQLRLTELGVRAAALDREKEAAITAYRAAFADLSDNEVAANLRKKTKADLDAVLAKEKALTVVVNRFNAYQRDITTAIRGATVIVNTLVWESGYPLDAMSEFTGILDTLANPQTPRVVKPTTVVKPALVWIQAASHAGAAVWGGPFRDANRDGLMEFVPYGSKLPADNWSPHLNFLGTRSPAGAVAHELAKDVKIRIVVQWREPADPNFPESDIPAYPLTLRLLRQINPAGEKRSSDEMEEVARSPSAPNVIFRTRTFLVFEQMLEYTVPAAGRYALMVESAGVPEPPLPSLRRQVEIYPRIALETVGSATSEPQVVFRSYTNFIAGVGTPGDALGAITIGTSEAGTQVSGGTGLTLRGKPDVIGPDSFTFGPQTVGGQGMATAFAGGTAAVLLQARFSAPNVFFATGIEPGKKLEVPERWLKIVPAVRTKP